MSPSAFDRALLITAVLTLSASVACTKRETDPQADEEPAPSGPTAGSGLLGDIKAQANVMEAENNADATRRLTELWREMNESDDCPNVDTLVKDQFLDDDLRRDPWGVAFQVSCEGSLVTVASGGPDKKLGTTDDIVVKNPVPDAEPAPEPAKTDPTPTTDLAR